MTGSEPTPEQILADLRRWYPRASIWYGHATRQWWASLPDGGLIEARTPAGLGRLLAQHTQQASPC